MMSTFWKPFRPTLFPMVLMWPGEASMAITLPVAPTAFAASRVYRPIFAPTSKTIEPGPICFFIRAPRKIAALLNLCEFDCHNRIRGCGYDGSIRFFLWGRAAPGGFWGGGAACTPFVARFLFA